MNNEEIQEKISFWTQVKEDFYVPKNNDPALDNNLELFFNYPGVWAIINYRIANKLYYKGWKKLSRVISGISSFLTKTDIHPACTIGRRVFIDHAIGVVIGATAIVEDDVLIYQGVTLGGVSLNKGKRHPTVRSNTVIGSGAKVLGNITIGKNSKIGANSVVVCDVPDNSTAVGVPARIIKKDDKNCKLAHGDLPDINKEMFKYLLDRIHLVEVALKEEDGIDLSLKDKKLEDDYNNFIEAMNSIKKERFLNFELAIFGIATGFTSGFFGVGGGMVLVPMLLMYGFVMKEAVAISIMQMVFSSIYGSFLNAKKAKDVVKDGTILGIGGSIGGIASGYILSSISNESLQYLFIAILIFSILRIFSSPAVQIEEKKDKNIFILLFIGFCIGILAMSIGVGGSILLTPILVGFLKYDLKAATALGLFFVIFSSIGGFVSSSYHGQMLFVEGATVGIGSLIGVYFGIKVKDMVKSTSYKKYVLTLYIIVLIAMLYKTI